MKLPADLSKDKRAVVSLLGVIWNHYIHQNQLLYSRTNVVLVLQVAGFAAGWAGGPVWGGLALLLVAFITICLWRITRRDRECRNANLGLMGSIEENLLPGDKWLPPDARTGEGFPNKIRVGTPPVGPAAGKIFDVLLWVLVAADLVVATVAFLGGFHKIDGHFQFVQ